MKGKIAWRHRLSSMITLPHATSDGGWDFDRLGRIDMFVGSVAMQPKIKGNKATAKLSPSMTVGFGTANGRVAWRKAGYYACGQPLPCPGRSEAGYTSPATATSASVGVRLVEKGTIVFARGKEKPKVSGNASVTVQGFDPRTGQTAWSFAAGRNLSLITEQGSPPENSANSIVLKTHSGYVAVDLRTGKTRHLAPTSHAWCLKTSSYHLSHTAYYDGGGGLYVTQQGLFPCTVEAHRTPLPSRLPSLVRLFGASADGMTAWTDAGAVYARPG